MRDALLIGYFPKRLESLPDGFADGFTQPPPDQIASVSECIVSGPDRWIDHWRHNGLLLFDSPNLAASVVSPTDENVYEIMQYSAFPFRIDRGIEVPWMLGDRASKGAAPKKTALKKTTADDCDPVPVPGDRVDILGYDLVCHSTDGGFGCSPLSCNGLANDWNTNRFCLIDDASDAVSRAFELDKVGAEPGPYCVIRVGRLIESRISNAPFSNR